MAHNSTAPASCHSTSSMRIAAEGTPVLALVGRPTPENPPSLTH